jgi:transposase
MGKPYSSDLRQRFVAALDEGMSASAAGRRMRIARSTAVRWAAIWRKEGRAEALPMGGDRRSEALEAHGATILGWVADAPDLFLNEIAAWLAAEGIESSESGISRLLARHGITRKKKALVAAEQSREDIAKARAAWRDKMPGLDPAKLIFIDESGFDTRMTRRCGRSKRGTACVGAVPHGHWRNNTFIAGLRTDRIDAPMPIEGAMDGDAFCAWVEPSLAPTLTAGGIVICDTLDVHKNARARAAIEARGAELRFLPAYAPDLNPIEMVLAKRKALVRSATARCAETLCTALKSALEAITPEECANDIRHAGYGST